MYLKVDTIQWELHQINPLRFVARRKYVLKEQLYNIKQKNVPAACPMQLSDNKYKLGIPFP